MMFASKGFLSYYRFDMNMKHVLFVKGRIL